MPHVLLGNDDGVFAPGLRALADVFLDAGWRVTVSAPDQERSAASHGITIKRPLVAVRVDWPDVAPEAPLAVWAVDGLPADCVKLALHELVASKPDIVVSGVNNGWNVGTDVHYSGTVAVALEAAFEDTPAIAVSALKPDSARYAYAAELALKMAQKRLEHPLDMPSVLNINIPDREPEDILGVVEAPLTRIRYTDAYDKMARNDKRSAYWYWLKGDIIEQGYSPDGDLSRLLQGYATITAIGWDLTMPGACAIFLQDEQ